MGTRRRASEPADRRRRHDRGASGAQGRALGAALLLCAALSAPAGGAEEEAGPPPPGVPAPLGASDAALRERFGDALRPAEAARAGSVFERIAPEAMPQPSGGTGTPPSAAPPQGPVQTRLARPSRGEVQRVEYDLADGRVYRVRWRLAGRFERPVLDEAVARLTQRLGRPAYDQTLRAELGSERSDLRRTGWSLEGRTLEIRQLHPFTGGPVFLSLADDAAMRAIVEAKGVPLPQPETTGAWWRRPQRPPELPTSAERRELVSAIDALAAKLAGRGQSSEP